MVHTGESHGGLSVGVVVFAGTFEQVSRAASAGVRTREGVRVGQDREGTAAGQRSEGGAWILGEAGRGGGEILCSEDGWLGEAGERGGL